ncbi:concanavalin A-like lectin/glucanase, partial [Ramicandelaber brevisporus]
SRHDWKLTFKKPYLYDNKTLPYWDLYGDAKLTPDYVRLSPNVAGSKGSMWAQQPNYHREWHAEFQAHISGTGDVGADGLAFWYTRERGQSGPILGSVDAWHGLGILIDSWDRDTDTANPYIFGVWDDGKLHLEGEKNKMGKILGGCYHDARNTQKPFWIKVVYHSDHHLQVFYDDNGTKWKQCFEAKDVDLPTGYYFGLSASTGDHPDDHDVLAFETYELNPPYK